MKLQPSRTGTALLLAAMLSGAVSAQAQTQPSRTSDVVARFNQAFERHDASLLENLIAEDCVMESAEPAPDGTRVVGRAANLAFWRKLANTRTVRSPWKTSWCSVIARTFAGAIASVPGSRNPFVESP